MDGNLCRVAEASGSPVDQSTESTWILDDLQATQRLGRALAGRLTAGAVLLLQGPLGAGKTSLVQGLACAVGIEEPITSPTFALAQHYPQGHPPLVHLDLYRLERPAAADDLFFQEDEEARGMGAVLVVEWPERLSDACRQACGDAWRLQLNHRDDGGRQALLLPPPG
ncbi:MAG: tRNA (adenosine(37)-N6)-threonylcarbamoyltransferase complex ATPase subunit type 1 TsaE [Synechococcus sp.]